MSSLISKLYSLPGIVLAIAFHEFAHAWMSDKLGDTTPKRQGRLTLNPTAHIDPLGMVSLIIFGFGWGKPVMINPAYYKHRRRDEILVGFAGVFMNLILAIVFSFPTKALNAWYVSSGSAFAETGFYICYYVVAINLCLMIFNLIPVPPLDGWGILDNLIDLRKFKWHDTVYHYGSYILIALILLNVTDFIITPCVSFFLKLLF